MLYYSLYFANAERLEVSSVSAEEPPGSQPVSPSNATNSYVPSFQQHLIIYEYQLTIADL